MAIISISAAVGIKASNRIDDVMKVQVVLNHFIGNSKLLGAKPLVIDGKCGSKTNEAILMFQIQNGLVSDEHFNGQIRPHGMTISYMNKNAGYIPPTSGTAGEPAGAPADQPPTDEEAIDAAMARIREVYGLTTAEEKQWKIILASIWKSEFAGFSNAADAVNTASNIHKWADFALDVFAIARTGFGAAPGTLLYAAGSISWSVGQVLGFIGPFLQFYSFVVALDHAMKADCRIYNAIAVAYGTTYWVHGGAKPINCRTFVSYWRTAAPQFRSNTETLESYWRSGFSKAINGLDNYALMQVFKTGKSVAENERRLRAPLRTIGKTTLSRAVLTSIAKEYRANGDINEADQIDWYAERLNYPD